MGILDLRVVNSVRDPVSLVAVSIIAFMLGADLTVKSIKKHGVKLLNIAVIDSILTFILVGLGLYYIAGQDIAIVLPLAALAASPAPTVVVPIVKELKAKGPFTSILLMISALEDITCVILISIAISISRPLLDSEPLSIDAIAFCAWEITGSLVVGAIWGWILNKLLIKLPVGQPKLLLTLTFIILGTGITGLLHLSALITILTTGFVVLNYGDDTEKLFKEVESISGPVMLVFFTVAGASLDPTYIPAAGLAVIIYIIARIISKFTGVYFACKRAKMKPEYCLYLPQCLLSQAGTTLGLTMLVAQQLPEVSAQILTVMISAIIFFEIIAPPLTRNILIKTGEANLD